MSDPACPYCGKTEWHLVFKKGWILALPEEGGAGHPVHVYKCAQCGNVRLVM